MTVRAVVTDIEGTTTSIGFVTGVLLPYSRARLADHLRAHAAALADIVAAVRAETADPALPLEGVIAQLERWHDEDRKIAPLKTVQGLIWAQGYADGTLTGHVYADAAAALRRWHAAGLRLYVYSSGSVAAQTLLFGHSVAGDLNPLFAGHFDTAIGAKREPGSYRAIAASIGLPAGDILFLSDVVEELDAAAAAGFATCLVARTGLPAACAHRVAETFDAIPGLPA